MFQRGVRRNARITMTTSSAMKKIAAAMPTDGQRQMDWSDGLAGQRGHGSGPSITRSKLQTGKTVRPLLLFFRARAGLPNSEEPTQEPNSKDDQGDNSENR